MWATIVAFALHDFVWLKIITTKLFVSINYSENKRARNKLNCGVYVSHGRFRHLSLFSSSLIYAL